MAFPKKLDRYRPNPEPALETQATKMRTKPIPCDSRIIEYGVRQLLADKVMGNLAGVWLLAPELWFIRFSRAPGRQRRESMDEEPARSMSLTKRAERKCLRCRRFCDR
jgi:hypothetical protein